MSSPEILESEYGADQSERFVVDESAYGQNNQMNVNLVYKKSHPQPLITDRKNYYEDAPNGYKPEQYIPINDETH